MKKLTHIICFGLFYFTIQSCVVIKSDGWAVDFRRELDKKRYNKTFSGRGWAGNFQSNFSKDRFHKSDSWSGYFKPHYNVERYCKNEGWAIDFRSNLNPDRFSRFNSNFFVMPSPKYQALRFSDSFSRTKNTKEGAFIFSKKDKSVKQKRIFKFRKKPMTNDSFGTNVEKREYRDNVYNKKKKTVTKRKGIFKRKREKPYKRNDKMEMNLFPFNP